jgi:tRNA dimethylallyltransferase
MGPTASGKTAVALWLAERFPVELVSVDSAQVFRDMDLGTAKPDAAVRRVFPHHLIDLISPEETYSAARFCDDALTVMREITARGRIPLLVGGTMLYYKALLDGLDELPRGDAAVRATLDARAAAVGWPAMHDELARVDPATAARLSPTDAQRIQRALEIFHLSGRPMSELIRRGRTSAPPYRFLRLGLLPAERSVLHTRIAERFDAMLRAGLEDEVSWLRRKYTLSLECPSMRCVGYRQVWQMQEGVIPRGEMRDRGIYATRQLAKRQITWMLNTLGPESFDTLAGDVCERIGRRVEAMLISGSEQETVKLGRFAPWEEENPALHVEDSLAFIAGCRGIIPLPGSFYRGSASQGFWFSRLLRGHNQRRGIYRAIALRSVAVLLGNSLFREDNHRTRERQVLPSGDGHEIEPGLEVL